MAHRAPWGKAKIEVIALADEILAQVEKGIPTRKIYNELRESGRITMAQSAFYQWVKELRSGTPSTPVKSGLPAKPSARSPASTPSSSPIASAEMRTLQYTEVDPNLWEKGIVDATEDAEPSETPEDQS